MNMRELEIEAESLREQVRALSEQQRRSFHDQQVRQVKDPDTFAVLAYFFGLGVHQFYLGNLARGCIDLFLFIVGAGLLVWGDIFFRGDALSLGVFCLLVLTVLEISSLFASQKIVFAHNNKVMRRLLREVSSR